MEEVQACARHLENVIGIEVALERTPAQETQGQLGVPAIRCAATPRAAVDNRPGPRDDGSNVARQRAGRGEVVAQRPRTFHLLDVCLDPVGGDDPTGGSDDVECPLRLNIRLIDARPRTVCVVGFELGVEVHLAVLRIRVAVEALTATRVARKCTDLQSECLPHG